MYKNKEIVDALDSVSRVLAEIEFKGKDCPRVTKIFQLISNMQKVLIEQEKKGDE